jgi:hypothetical protein
MQLRKRCLGAMAVLLALAVSAPAQSPLKNPMTGKVACKSIDAIAFGPQGLLLIGDGKGRQLIAVDTGDKTAMKWSKTEIKNINDELAGRLGTTGKGIEINKLAVNPASHKAYLAVRNRDNKSMDIILTIDGTGKIDEFRLDNVKHVVVPLPSDSKVSSITYLAWAGDRVLVAGGATNETFGSKIVSVTTPLGGEACCCVSTETYHVGHGRWETAAPLRVVIPYIEDGKNYVVGSFTCTPIVKYPLDDLKDGAKVKGTSVIELGTGNTPRGMFTYEKNGKNYILMNQIRGKFGKDNPVGPSPYWVAKVDQSILRETAKINEKAIWRVSKKGKASEPLPESLPFVSVPADYFGVVHMDRLDRERALVVRTDDKGGFDMKVLPLP